MDEQLQDRVRHLEDLEAIRRVLFRRARATDERDLEGSLACYHPGATEDHEGYDGPIDTYLRTASPAFEEDSPVLDCFHLLGNTEIDLDGDRASSCAYFACFLTVRQDDGSRRHFVNAGRYLDRLERQDGGWGITRRRCVYDWSRNDAATTSWWEAAQSGTG